MEKQTEIPSLKFDINGSPAAAAQKLRECWLAENKDALDSSNDFVEQHGLPLAQYRNF